MTQATRRVVSRATGAEVVIRNIDYNPALHDPVVPSPKETSKKATKKKATKRRGKKK